MCLCLGYHVSDVSKHKSHLSDTMHVNIGDRVNVYIEWMFTSEETVMSHPLHDQSVYLVSSVGISGIRYHMISLNLDTRPPSLTSRMTITWGDLWVHHNYWYHMISLNLATPHPSLTSRMTITRGDFWVHHNYCNMRYTLIPHVPGGVSVHFNDISAQKTVNNKYTIFWHHHTVWAREFPETDHKPLLQL